MGADALLRTGFDGDQLSNPYDLIEAGIEDPRHRERVPGLTALLADGAVPATDRFLACYALTAWAEAGGYSGVIDAAAAGKQTSWYDTLIDRTYSVDSTFAHLAMAISDGEHLARGKRTESKRTEAVRALIGIADTEYFDGKLEYVLDEATAESVIEDIKSVVERGVQSSAEGERPGFDLPTQLVDLAAAVATVDGPTAVDLATRVIAEVTHSHYRTLNHAVAIVYRAKGFQGQVFGEYLKTIGNEKIRDQVDEVLASRH
ncbi:hypothetical protein [Streptomyces sp. MP131-18]|uniref:hypothetical protein n=1 Tax=Streptomyces sp. MP131-18 TaxID=1857892 RepID=UPI0009A1A8AA|nr:hypothetical protein [Streptomyces sp. MP131-18]ONK13782.1 hypothetical protein STBA_45550 [Streptomyces sp. MP131-18]